MRACEVMTREVATVRPATPIGEAIGIMLDRRVSGLPVVDDAGAVVGILSEGDLLRRVELGTERRRPGWLAFLRGPEREAADYVRSHTLLVDDVMTHGPETVDESATLDDVVNRMVKRHVRRLPVTSGGKLVGIVTRADLVRTLAANLAQRPRAARGDDEILAAILQEIRHQPWWNACSVSVTVQDGQVDITGVVFQETVLTALRVAAENAEGVRGVHVNADFVSQIPVGA